MYWKFKLPLIIIMVGLLAFIIYYGFSFYQTKSAENSEKQQELQQSEATQLETKDEDLTPQPQKADPADNVTVKPTQFNVPEIQRDGQPQQPADMVESQVTVATPPAPQQQPSEVKPLQKNQPLPLPATLSQGTAQVQQLPPTSTVTTAPALPQPRTTPQVNTTELLEQARILVGQNRRVEARNLAQQALKAPQVREYDPTWRQAAQMISDINRDFTFKTIPCPEKKNYTIQEGDVLVRIAHKQKTSLQAILAMNPGIKPRTLWVGKKIKYMDGDWSIKVSKSNFMLALYRNGELFRVYPVGIGKDGRTPVGTFKIKDKVMNPAWDSPEGRILPGDPRNILGTRWMGLVATGNTSDQLVGYGIHGTTLPETVGTPSSAGCVRLKNPDVNDLYTYIPEPSSAPVPVLIVD